MFTGLQSQSECRVIYMPFQQNLNKDTEEIQHLKMQLLYLTMRLCGALSEGLMIDCEDQLRAVITERLIMPDSFIYLRF